MTGSGCRSAIRSTTSRPSSNGTIPASRKFQAGPYYYRANGFRTIENFVDASHFPFVHAGINGVPTDADTIERYDVHRGEHGLYTDEIWVYQPYGDHRARPVNAGYTYHCFRPLTAYFNKHTVLTDGSGGNDDRFCMMTTVQPVEEDRSVVWLGVAINFGRELTEQEITERRTRSSNRTVRSSKASAPRKFRSIFAKSCICGATSSPSNTGSGLRKWA